MIMAEQFVHLHLHTEYSFPDGACRISDVLETAKMMGMDSVAITDHDAMYGAISFYRTADNRGMHAVIGAEISVEHVNHRSGDTYPYHLVLLARDNLGYENLMKLVTLGFTRGYFRQPRVTKGMLTENAAGLIALSGCLKGEVPSLLSDDNQQAAEKAAQEYARIFGPGNFYIELSNQGLPAQTVLNPGLAEIARVNGLPVVATNNVHYVLKEDATAHDCLLCIRTDKAVQQEDRALFPTDEFYLKSPENMATAFSGYEEALANTAEIASRCEVDIAYRVNVPGFTPSGEPSQDLALEKLVRKGIEARYREQDERIHLWLAEELGVIRKLNLSGYFLLVWDLIQHARASGAMVGPGRGSAPGSLVNYALGITAVDPLRYGHYFERFLSTEHRPVPDIDIDIDLAGRREAVDYLFHKYGERRMAHVVSFSKLKSRGAIKRVCEVLGVPEAKKEDILRTLKDDPWMGLDTALRDNEHIDTPYQTDDQIREAFEIANKLENLGERKTIHSAGILIADGELENLVPLQRTGGTFTDVVSQYDMYALEELGLTKQDLVGLRSLSAIRVATEEINKRHGLALDIDSLPLDDDSTIELIRNGETVGVFQLGSPGMRSLIRRAAPKRFEDVAALTALYRPGPIKSGLCDYYVERKHGRSAPMHLHPLVDEILAETCGVIVYQEQMVEILKQLAAYSKSEAELFRRAMAKKKSLDAEESKFIQRATAEGVAQTTAAEIFELLEQEGPYSFSKTHAVGQTLISFQAAYLKAHYPVEYMEALLKTYKGCPRYSDYVSESHRMGLQVPPDDS